MREPVGQQVVTDQENDVREGHAAHRARGVAEYSTSYGNFVFSHFSLQSRVRARRIRCLLL